MKPILLLNKPAVLKKMQRYRMKIKQGEYALQMIELNWSNHCNFSCQHCFSKNFSYKENRLNLNIIKSLADQADQLGVWQWHLQGGEPLIWKDLNTLIHVIGPKRFQIFITTNGWYLTEKLAKNLVKNGVDKLSVSLDSWDSQQHDLFRGKQGAFDRALTALYHSKNAGLQTTINIVVTQQNLHSPNIHSIFEYANKNGYAVLILIATPTGAWEGKMDFLIRREDSIYIETLRKKYPFIHRDITPTLGIDWGCRTMNGIIYITPGGDVLSCPFIHIRIGNILQEPLHDIVKRGWRVKYFRDYQPRCLAGEDHHFINSFITKTYGHGIIPFNEAFNSEDLYEK